MSGGFAIPDSGDRAVLLLSGGLDSATCLALAKAKGRAVHALTVSYGQRHAAELAAARALAADYEVEEHRIVSVSLDAIGGSALTGDLPVPKAADPGSGGIPATYVPARNTIFLALALAHAEVAGASEIWCGVNAVDYSGYPDCRPEFLRAFQALAGLATRVGVEGGRAPRLVAPLLEMSKKEIVLAARDLGLDLGRTTSCYDPDESGRACGSCDACLLRARGFREAGLPDPTRYRPGIQIESRPST